MLAVEPAFFQSILRKTVCVQCDLIMHCIFFYGGTDQSSEKSSEGVHISISATYSGMEIDFRLKYHFAMAVSFRRVMTVVHCFLINAELISTCMPAV